MDRLLVVSFENCIVPADTDRSLHNYIYEKILSQINNLPADYREKFENSSDSMTRIMENDSMNPYAFHELFTRNILTGLPEETLCSIMDAHAKNAAADLELIDYIYKHKAVVLSGMYKKYISKVLTHNGYQRLPRIKAREINHRKGMIAEVTYCDNHLIYISEIIQENGCHNDNTFYIGTSESCADAVDRGNFIVPYSSERAVKSRLVSEFDAFAPSSIDQMDEYVCGRMLSVA